MVISRTEIKLCETNPGWPVSSFFGRPDAACGRCVLRMEPIGELDCEPFTTINPIKKFGRLNMNKTI